jgi:hypothetical protein
VIVEPPVAGAVQLRATVVLAGVATTPVGTPGAVTAGTTALEALEAAPVPSEFVAVTVRCTSHRW